MQKVQFGNTGIELSRLCIGTGTSRFGENSLQAKISPEYYAIILQKAFNIGINFWDTSDNYGTYAHLREGLKTIKRENVVITSKTYADNEEAAQKSVERTLQELNTDYIDIFLMQEVDSISDYYKRFLVLAYLHKLKQKGVIRAVGASTHSIDSLEFLVNLSELDVILTNFNKAEEHMDAGVNHYGKALTVAHENGKGVYVMKVLNEGRLAARAQELITHALSQPFIHSVCVGINSMEEVDALIKTGSSVKGQGSREL